MYHKGTSKTQEASVNPVKNPPHPICSCVAISHFKDNSKLYLNEQIHHKFLKTQLNCTSLLHITKNGPNHTLL